jgi:hypothetical protein
MVTTRAVRTLTVALQAAVFLGCADPNTYGTPRTLAPGGTQFQLSLSGMAGSAQGRTDVSPALPSVGLRRGVADRVDFGVRVMDLSALAADLKLNFLRGPFDMAIDPGVQAFWGDTLNPPVGTLQFHLPLMLGINFDEATTLVLVPGAVASVSTAKEANAGPSAIAIYAPGFGARMGIGLNIHTGYRISWQPEVTVVHEFNTLDTWLAVFGLGLSLGNQPDYSDLNRD